MRKTSLLGAGLVALLGLGVAILLVERSNIAPPSAEIPAPVSASAPSPAPEATIAALPAPPVAPAAAPPPAPDLPTIAVAQRPVHPVPEEDTPAPRVTLFDRSGKELPSSRRIALTPPPAPVPPQPAPIAGPAQASGGNAVAIAGRAVKLFGVRLAEPRDRCNLGPGDRRNCAEVAQDALEQRLKRYPNVTCQVPAGLRGDLAAVCRDASGTDLGGFLVAEGLALADLGQSYEYFGSEGVARSFRRGLWRYR